MGETRFEDLAPDVVAFAKRLATAVLTLQDKHGFTASDIAAIHADVTISAPGQGSPRLSAVTMSLHF